MRKDVAVGDERGGMLHFDGFDEVGGGVTWRYEVLMSMLMGFRNAVDLRESSRTGRDVRYSKE